MTIAFKISKPNVDVLTASDKDLIFTSDRNCLKAYLENTVNTNASGDLTINHSLGYVPCFTAFTADSADLTKWYSYDAFTDIYADSNNLYIVGANGGVQSKVYYAIFVDQV